MGLAVVRIYFCLSLRIGRFKPDAVQEGVVVTLALVVCCANRETGVLLVFVKTIHVVLELPVFDCSRILGVVFYFVNNREFCSCSHLFVGFLSLVACEKFDYNSQNFGRGLSFLELN